MVMEILEKKHTSVNQCKNLHCQTIAYFDSVTIVNGNSVQVYTKCNGVEEILTEQAWIWTQVP